VQGANAQSGCGCRVAGEPAPDERWPPAVLVAIALGTGRRRRRVSHP
jgi:MYXO-CTERM domain-containing protein